MVSAAQHQPGATVPCGLSEAVDARERDDAAAARSALGRSESYLAPEIELAMSAPDAGASRLQAEAELRFAKLECGFRLLDTGAQLAPLVGLFGTVLTMIDAAQAGTRQRAAAPAGNAAVSNYPG